VTRASVRPQILAVAVEEFDRLLTSGEELVAPD
jgi:hypothetical protein